MTRWNPESAYERVMKRTVMEGRCTVFTGYRDAYGYGVVGEGQGSTKILKAHRVVYEHEVGSIPDGMVIDHLCQTPACVDVQHMEVVTPVENTKRAAERRHSEWMQTCAQCGKDFLLEWRQRNHEYKSERRFCSHDCYLAWRRVSTPVK